MHAVALKPTRVANFRSSIRSCTRMHYFEMKKNQKFSGEGATLHLKLLPLSTFGASILASARPHHCFLTNRTLTVCKLHRIVTYTCETASIAVIGTCKAVQRGSSSTNGGYTPLTPPTNRTLPAVCAVWSLQVKYRLAVNTPPNLQLGLYWSIIHDA